MIETRSVDTVLKTLSSFFTEHQPSYSVFSERVVFNNSIIPIFWGQEVMKLIEKSVLFDSHKTIVLSPIAQKAFKLWSLYTGYQTNFEMFHPPRKHTPFDKYIASGRLLLIESFSDDLISLSSLDSNLCIFVAPEWQRDLAELMPEKKLHKISPADLKLVPMEADSMPYENAGLTYKMAGKLQLKHGLASLVTMTVEMLPGGSPKTKDFLISNAAAKPLSVSFTIPNTLSLLSKVCRSRYFYIIIRRSTDPMKYPNHGQGGRS